MLKVIWQRIISCSILFAMISWPGTFDWVSYQKNNSHNAYSNQSLTGQFVQKWSKQTSLSHFEMPLYQNGIFYFTEISDATNAFTLYAVRRDDNTELWRYSGSSLTAPTVRVGLNNVIVSGDKLISLNNKTGVKAWEVVAGASSAFTKMSVDLKNVYVWKKLSSGGFSICLYNIYTGVLINEKNVFEAHSVTEPIIKDPDSYVAYNTGTEIVVKYLDTYYGGLYDTVRIPGSTNQPMVFSEGYGFVTSSTGSVTPIDLYQDTSLKTFFASSATTVVGQDDRTYFLSNDLLTNSIQLNSLGIDYDWDVDDNIYYIYDYKATPLVNGTAVNPKTTPIIVGDKIYFGMKNGEVWSVGLDGTGLKKYKVAPNGAEITSLILANDTFVATSIDGKTMYAFGFDASVVPAVTLNSPYKNDGDYHEYLGEIHDHYIPDILPKSAGTPAKTVQKYKDAGYDFVALTEHNSITPNPNVDGITFIENAEEDTQYPGGNHILATGIKDAVNEKADNQARVNQVENQGGFSSLAHPNSFNYQWKLNNLLQLAGLNGMEVFNSGIDHAGKYLDLAGLISGWNVYDEAYATDKWDSLLSNRKIIYATAGDDYTPGNPGFDGGAVVVMSRDNTQAEIMNNLKVGNFYAVQGSKAPRIQVSTDGVEIKVDSNQISTIKFIGNGGKVLKESGSTNDSIYEASGDEIYVRVEVTGDNGLKSWSQPIFVDKKQDKSISGAGAKTLTLDQASLQANTSDTMSASVLSSSDIPSTAPKWGYLSPIYDFATSGSLVGQAELVIDYSSQKLLTAEDSLSIFTFNTASNIWEKVSSTVDKVNKKVTANLSHFSVYTLSSDATDDNVAPTLELANQDEIESVSGQVDLLINATDNNQVYNVSGYLDEQTLVFSDSDGMDGFDQAVDFAKYPVGKHKLTLSATDTFGNRTTKEYSFKIVDPSKTPQIKIIESRRGKDECKKFVIRGKYLNTKGATVVNVFLGNTKLGDVPVKDGTFSYTFDPSVLTENQYIITVKAKDKNGQTVIKKIRVQNGCHNTKSKQKKRSN